MEEKKCGNCKNFVRHYVKFSTENYRTTNCGHCIKPRIKERVRTDKSCANWEK